MRELDDLIDRNMAVDMLVYRPDEFEHRIKLGDPFIKCHRQLKVDPPTGEKRSLLIVILLVLPTDFWTRPIGFLFS